MQQYKKILGKVMMTAEGTYDSNKGYDPISLITDEETGKSYISRKEVPAGTQINNREYWQPVASSGIIDNGVIILNRKNSDGQVPIYDLKSAAEAVAVGDRKGGVILGFLGFNPETDTVPTWKLYQYNDVSPSNWTNIDYWLPMDYTNKYAGWFDNEEALYDSVPFPKIGMYAYVGNSVSSAIIYRCYNDRVWYPTEDKAFSGVVNLADEEDITSKQNKLKFKDKEYNPAQFSGLGKLYLRKNIIDEKNILTQTMMQATNTIYIIQYDYDLQGQTITIPEECTLDFQGGSFSNGTIVGNNTTIKASLVKIFGLDVELIGSWNIAESYPEWFGAKADSVTDDAKAINLCISTFSDKNTIIYLTGKYAVTNINVSKNCNIQGTLSASLVHIGDGICMNVAPPDNITTWTQFIRTKICNLKIQLNSKSKIGLRINQCIGSIFEKIFITGSNLSVPTLEDSEHPETFTNPSSIGVFVDGTSNIEPNNNSVFNNNFCRVVSNKVDIGFDFNGIISDSKFYNIESNIVGYGVRINSKSSYNLTFEDCQFVDTNIGFCFNDCLVSSFVKGCNIEMYRYYGIYKQEYPNDSILNIVSNGLTTKHNTKKADIFIKSVTCSQISNNIIGWGAPSGIPEEQLSPEQKSDIIGNPNSCLIYGNRAQNGKLVVYNTAIKNSNFIVSYQWINDNNYSHIAGNTHLEHFASSDFDLFNESNVLKMKLKGSKYVSFRKKDGIELFLPTGASNTDMSIVKDAEIGTLIYRTDLKVPIWRTPDWQWREIDGCLPGVPRVGRYQDRPTAEYYKISTGFCYFDIDNNKPIWWTGSKWVDANGTEV